MSAAVRPIRPTVKAKVRQRLEAEPEIRMAFYMSPELHQEIRLRAAFHRQSMRDYLTDLIEAEHERTPSPVRQPRMRY